MSYLSMNNTQTAQIEYIAKVVKQGRCILFLGAGIHYYPPKKSPYSYPEEHRPPLGSALAEDLADKSEFAKRFAKESKENLQRVSLHYELHKGRKALVDKVKTAVHVGKKPSPVLRALAELDFPLVATTNYDKLFEAALYAAGKSPVVSSYGKDRNVKTVDYDEDPPNPEHPFLFKIHGDIDDRKSIVITDEDYIDFILRMSDNGMYNPIPETFSYYFKKWPTLFIGYSLMDYNLRLLFKTLRWIGDQSNIPRSYSVDPYPDSLIHKVYSQRKDFVQFVVENVWTFMPALYLAIKGKEMPQ
jgi:hypothetical protein